MQIYTDHLPSTALIQTAVECMTELSERPLESLSNEELKKFDAAYVSFVEMRFRRELCSRIAKLIEEIESQPNLTDEQIHCLVKNVVLTKHVRGRGAIELHLDYPVSNNKQLLLKNILTFHARLELSRRFKSSLREEQSVLHCIELLRNRNAERGSSI